MELQSTRAASKFGRTRPAIECAQCGESLYVPEWSEYLDAGRVRHMWECDVCRYTFETTIRYAAA